MYRSPLHILSDWDQNPELISQPGYLLRLRKQWLAEFHLSNAATIEIKGTPYSKDEIIKTIDQLLDNPALALHVFIFSHKALLDFLENDDAKVKPASIKALVIPQEFRSALHALLLERYTQKFKHAFAAPDIHALNELWQNKPDFDAFENETLYEDIHRHISAIVTELTELPDYNIAEMKDQFAFLKKKTWADFLNALPEEFSGLKDTFVAAVINALVAYQKTGRSHDKSYTYCVSLVLLEIQCDESLMLLIKNNHKIFTGNFNGETSTSSDNSWIAKIFYFIIILGVFATRHYSCEPKTHYDPHNALQNWPVKVVAPNEAQTFASYRESLIKNGMARRRDHTFETEVYLDRSYSGRSPFKEVIDGENTVPDSSFRKVLVSNNTDLKLILVSFNTSSADAFVFFPGQPDTLSFRTTDKLCFYFGDSLYQLNAQLKSALKNTADATNMAEIYFTKNDPMTLALLNKNFILELNTKKRNRSKSSTALPELKLTDDFFITSQVTTKQLKLYSDGLFKDTGTP